MNKDEVYLKHILDSICKIQEYAQVGKQAFMLNTHWQDAIIRQLEIIGEATKRVSSDIREANTTIPWRRMAGLRDVLIHEYMGVDVQAIWKIVEKDIPNLKIAISSLLKQ